MVELVVWGFVALWAAPIVLAVLFYVWCVVMNGVLACLRGGIGDGCG
jgi:hypothetical protein